MGNLLSGQAILIATRIANFKHFADCNKTKPKLAEPRSPKFVITKALNGRGSQDRRKKSKAIAFDFEFK
jgi:hypothetical protein